MSAGHIIAVDEIKYLKETVNKLKNENEKLNQQLKDKNLEY